MAANCVVLRIGTAKTVAAGPAFTSSDGLAIGGAALTGGLAYC